MIGKEQPELDWMVDNFRNLVVEETIEDRPTLHLDDFSEIPVIGSVNSSRILQQRARLRAADGDWVALSRSVERGYSDYCEYQLGLGRVNWLTSAVEQSSSRHIALQCWRERRLRHDLIHAIRHDGLRYIHPHISTLHIWELAARLSCATRMPISVTGPTPAVSRWTNNKIEFTRVAARLLGSDFVPHTECAFNFATLAKKVFNLAATYERLCLKYPYGTGGDGNFIINSSSIRGRTLSQVHQFLRSMLAGYRWPESGRILIDVWETDVLSSPSVQTWIPPMSQGEPIIEGLFNQLVTSEKGEFVGSTPAQFPQSLEQLIVNQSYLLAYLFQHLGCVGRCSFDLILIGEDVNRCRPEFIECNGRWGGTSIPMTLMNRFELFDQENTFGIRRLQIDGLDQIEFSELRRWLGGELYDARTGKGRFQLFNPTRLKQHSSIEVIAIAKTTKEVEQLLADILPSLLKRFVCEHSNLESDTMQFLLGHANFENTQTQKEIQ